MINPVSFRLYSVFHKAGIVPTVSYVIPIHAGAANSTHKLPMLRDDTGNHISMLNTHFSELTACYWVWKNADRSGIDAWGLCHYRRYFSKDVYKLGFIKRGKYNYAYTQQNVDSIINDDLYTRLQALLSNHDAVVQRPLFAHREKDTDYTIGQAYAHAHNEEHWKLTLAIIRERYPEYTQSIAIFNNNIKMSYYNMMLAKWKVWDEYLEWLFTILFAVQKRIKISTDPYQSRVFGFLSERLLNLYLLHHNLKLAYVTIALFEK